MKKSSFFSLLLLLSSCSLDINLGSNSSSGLNGNTTTSGEMVASSSTNVTSIPTTNPSTSINSTQTPSTVTSTISPSSSSSTTSNITSNTGSVDNYYKAGDQKYTLRATNEMIYWNTLKSTGNQKVLVVPVQFKNGTTWTNVKKENLNKIFFCEEKDTNWESVKSYFNKSSYGKLNITGEVYSETLQVNMTASEYNKKYNNDKNYTYDPGNYMGDLLNNSISKAKAKEYDQDGDGYLDAVIFCYSNKYSTDSDSVYWAWVSGANYESNTTKPITNIHMWVSYEFINDTYNSNSTSSLPTGLDGHTFIHEMGHILGLDDYYCYDSNNAWDCAGELDMQSYNVGDHNIYSKFSLGWVNPYVVTGNADIKLRSSALYGDAILINNNWNGTIFDEYILIEFYTPEGLNEQDSKYAFDSRDQMYDYSGLRIYHVDARLVKMNDNSDSKNEGYVKDNEIDSALSYVGDSIYYYIGASNSVSYSYLKDSQNPSNVRLLHLIDKGSKNTLANGNNSRKRSSILVDRSSALWETGDIFEAKSSYFYKGNDTFNDGSSIGYTVEVGTIENGEITVSVRVK